MDAFIFDHGANVWNWLPVDGIREHLQEVVSGDAQGLLAFDCETLVGMMTYCHTHDYAKYQRADLAGTAHGYVSEAVVHRDYAGKGLGSRLLKAAVDDLRAQGMREVYISRHEENLASAGMMRKCGFVEIDTYVDERRNNTGSGRTTVCCLRFDDQA
jgi:L-amino acid N-acyltransferase YncA